MLLFYAGLYYTIRIQPETPVLPSFVHFKLICLHVTQLYSFYHVTFDFSPFALVTVVRPVAAALITTQLFHRDTNIMENDAGVLVDLYVPRKCAATSTYFAPPSRYAKTDIG